MKARSYCLSLAILLALVTGNIMAGVKFAPVSAEEYVNLAWSLATNPEAAHRNGAEAVKYADRACRQTGFRQPMFVGVLAAAYAEDGRFPEATTAAKCAIELATQTGDDNARNMNLALLQLYQNHQPYHLPPAVNH